MPTSVDRVRTYLGLTAARPVDDSALEDAVKAANDWVAEVRPDLPTDNWPARADMAATIYAAKLYGGRGAVQGVAGFAEAGVAYLPRMHPEVRQLLNLGEFQESAVG